MASDGSVFHANVSVIGSDGLVFHPNAPVFHSGDIAVSWAGPRKTARHRHNMLATGDLGPSKSKLKFRSMDKLAKQYGGTPEGDLFVKGFINSGSIDDLPGVQHQTTPTPPIPPPNA